MLLDSPDGFSGSKSRRFSDQLALHDHMGDTMPAERLSIGKVREVLLLRHAWGQACGRRAVGRCWPLDGRRLQSVLRVLHRVAAARPTGSSLPAQGETIAVALAEVVPSIPMRVQEAGRQP
jgi:hypothetical protein